MKQMMEQAGNSHLLNVHSYPDAGHLIEPPYSPHVRFSNFLLVGTRKKGKPSLWVSIGVLGLEDAAISVVVSAELWISRALLCFDSHFINVLFTLDVTD